MAVATAPFVVGEQLLLRLEQAVARATSPAAGNGHREGRQIVLGPRCRLCGVGSGTSILPDGSVYHHAQRRLTERGLCDACERSRLYRLAHGMRPDRPDPPFDSRKGRRARLA